MARRGQHAVGRNVRLRGIGISVTVDVDSSAEDAITAATRLIDQALRATDIAHAGILGIGVGIACPVDRATGRLRAEGIMRAWVDVKPAERTGLRGHVINDANAAVLADVPQLLSDGQRGSGAVRAPAARA